MGGASTDRSPLAKGQFRVSLTASGILSHAEHDVSAAQHEPGVEHQDQADRHVLDFGIGVVALAGQYVPVDGIALEMMLPFHVADVGAEFLRDGAELPGFTSIHHRPETLTGVGDPSLGVRWAALAATPTSPVSLSLILGLHVPLGATEPDPFARGSDGLEHQHLFFGTGTFDPRFGVEATYQATHWALQGWAQGRVPLYANGHDYRGPTVLEAGLGVLSGLGLDGVNFVLQPEIFHEVPARWGDQPAENSGRTAIQAMGGVVWMPAPGWMVHMSAKTPLYSVSEGGQLDMPLLTTVGVSRTFGPTPE